MEGYGLGSDLHTEMRRQQREASEGHLAFFCKLSQAYANETQLQLSSNAFIFKFIMSHELPSFERMEHSTQPSNARSVELPNLLMLCLFRIFRCVGTSIPAFPPTCLCATAASCSCQDVPFCCGDAAFNQHCYHLHGRGILPTSASCSYSLAVSAWKLCEMMHVTYPARCTQCQQNSARFCMVFAFCKMFNAAFSLRFWVGRACLQANGLS
eukprot:4628642-Amphidinium_carterae.1